MTCIERDINREVTKQVIDARLPGATFEMGFYAHDTIVVSKSKNVRRIIGTNRKTFRSIRA